MTSFVFIFGLMPLWYALGAGAVARRLIGTVTIVGMAFSSGFAIFLVSVLFVAVGRLAARGKREPAEEEPQAKTPEVSDHPVSTPELAAAGSS
jgi:hydrophobic/amphiphilic exporter-1 (mainly G- bacteria), HAE1 family